MYNVYILYILYIFFFLHEIRLFILFERYHTIFLTLPPFIPTNCIYVIYEKYENVEKTSLHRFKITKSCKFVHGKLLRLQ